MSSLLRLSVLKPVLLSSLACLALAPQLADAQDYPNKAIRIIVPSTPGVPQDVIARTAAPEMSKMLGQPIFIENKPGADQVIGLDFVKQQPADGYNLVLVAVGSLVTLPILAKELRFDPLKDFPPITTMAEGRYVIGSPAVKPWKTFQELVAHGKANPGKLNFGASNNSVRMLAEAITRGNGLNVVYVPYSQASAYLGSLVSGEVDMGVVAESATLSFGERFRTLAVTGSQRRAPLMDVPTFAELGMPQIPSTSYSLNAATGTPKAVIDKVYAAATHAMQQQVFRDQMAKVYMVVIADTPDQAAKKLADDARFYADIAKKIGL